MNSSSSSSFSTFFCIDESVLIYSVITSFLAGTLLILDEAVIGMGNKTSSSLKLGLLVGKRSEYSGRLLSRLNVSLLINPFGSAFISLNATVSEIKKRSFITLRKSVTIKSYCFEITSTFKVIGSNFSEYALASEVLNFFVNSAFRSVTSCFRPRSSYRALLSYLSSVPSLLVR